MIVINTSLNKLKVGNMNNFNHSEKLSEDEIIPAGKTVYFRNGKMYKVFPSDKESWYDAKYLVSDGILYDLENIESIRSIKIPAFGAMDVFSGYGVTGYLDYVIRMKAGNFYNRNEKELCSACLWKSTELMLANGGWQKKDLNRLIYWHYELGMFEEAESAKEYLKKYDQYTQNPFDYNAFKIKNYVLRDAEKLETDLVAFNDYGTGCCAECAKLRGRVYSISGKSKIFPKLPEYAKNNGNFHPGCRCTMSCFFETGTEIFYKGKWTNAKKASRRSWKDDRDNREKALYEEYLERIENDKQEEINREEYSIKKGKDRLEYEKILEAFPNIAPKSLTGYRRMKTMKTKNFMKLCELAKEKDIDIVL